MFLTLHYTAFHLFLNHGRYIQNVIFILKLFLIEHFRTVISHLFFSVFENLPRWRLLVQDNGNLNFWNILNMDEIQCTNFVQSQQLNYKNNVRDNILEPLLSISDVWVLTTQLDICNGTFFAIQWNFQLGSKYTSETLSRFYFDYWTLIWLVYLRISNTFISTFIQKYILKKKFKQFYT